MNFRDRLRISSEIHLEIVRKESKEFRLNNPNANIDDFIKSRGGVWNGYIELQLGDRRLYEYIKFK